MQPGTLTAPAPSNYVNHVTAVIDKKMTNNQQIAALGSIICAVPMSNSKSIDSDLSNKDVVSYEVVLKNIYRLNSDCQAVILKSTPGFQSWLTGKMYCKDEAIKQYSISVLKELNLSYLFNDPTEVLLRHVFKELTLNSNIEEIDELLGLSRTEEEVVSKSKSYLQLVAEKVISFASAVLSIITIPIAIYSAYLLWSNAHGLIQYAKIEYLPILVNKLINYTPVMMIRIANKIYDWKWTIYLTALVVSISSLNNYRFIRIPIYVLNEFAQLPYRITQKILSLPFAIALKSYEYVHSTSKKTAHLMRQGSNFIESLRLSRELKQAEILFVNQVMKLKVIQAA